MEKRNQWQWNGGGKAQEKVIRARKAQGTGTVGVKKGPGKGGSVKGAGRSSAKGGSQWRYQGNFTHGGVHVVDTVQLSA